MKDITSKNKNIASIVTVIFTALISVSGFITISPATTVMPITLQNMFAVLAGCILGGVQGAGATGLFLVAGVLGLPIFAGGNAGIEYLSSVEGGYVIGYFFASLIAGILVGRPSVENSTPLPKVICAGIVGYIVVYVLGFLQYMNATQSTIQEGFKIAVIPFLPYDGIKLLMSVIITTKVRPILEKYALK